MNVDLKRFLIFQLMGNRRKWRQMMEGQKKWIKKEKTYG